MDGETLRSYISIGRLMVGYHTPSSKKFFEKYVVVSKKTCEKMEMVSKPPKAIPKKNDSTSENFGFNPLIEI